jgi:hypothetical protein
VKGAPLLQAARKSYYAALLDSQVLCMTAGRSPSNADRGSATSVAIAQAIFEQIQSKAQART